MQDWQKKFFQDPDWPRIEQMILKFIDPLKDMGTIDTKAPAEHVKAEILGRVYAYNALRDFLYQSHIISTPLKKLENIFK